MKLLKIIAIAMTIVIVGFSMSNAEIKYPTFPNFDVFHALEILRNHFDEIYPGISEEDKKEIFVELHQVLKEDHYVYSIDLSYKGEVGVAVSVNVDSYKPEIISYTNWDFAALINDYKHSISRDELYEIVLPVYREKLREAMKKYPDKAQAFLDRYGDNQLAPEIMVVDGLFCSAYGILDTDESSYWQVFLSHPYDCHPLTHITYSDGWFYAKIDATTGDIIESHIYENRIFHITYRLE